MQPLPLRNRPGIPTNWTARSGSSSVLKTRSSSRRRSVWSAKASKAPRRGDGRLTGRLPIAAMLIVLAAAVLGVFQSRSTSRFAQRLLFSPMHHSAPHDH